MQTQASSLVTFGMLALTLLPLGLVPWALARAAPGWWLRGLLGMCAWFGFWGVLAATGVLAQYDWRPPPIALLVFASLAAGLWLGLSRFGGEVARAVPLWALVLSQGFRLPLELVMHQAASEHVMPAALSFSGYNFDIVTGTSALLLGVALRRGASPRLALIWSAYGSVCLVAIAIIAVLTSPLVAALGPLQLNTWISRVPFVWLPCMLVTFAIAGHCLVFRKLRAEMLRTPQPSAAQLANA